jgi:hypothetical protein
MLAGLRFFLHLTCDVHARYLRWIHFVTMVRCGRVVSAGLAFFIGDNCGAALHGQQLREMRDRYRQVTE